MKLSHLGKDGAARMVDVSGKPPTVREAVARGRIRICAPAMKLVREGGLAKGGVVEVARLAGILAAKRTSDVIPLCHPLALTSVTVDLTLDEKRSAVDIRATCRLRGRTGVEMEAMTAVSVAALTVYDMCKAVDRGMLISDIKLTHKSGGKSGIYEASR